MKFNLSWFLKISSVILTFIFFVNIYSIYLYTINASEINIELITAEDEASSEDEASNEDEASTEDETSNEERQSQSEEAGAGEELPEAVHQPDIDLYAHGAVLMDAMTGRVLFGKNADEVMANASTTKIMTLIVALENGNPDDFAKVSAYAATMPRVRLNVRAGDYYRLEDLFYSLMLESYNDVAVVIAEHIGGSVEGFAAMMNQKAREIGCNDTYFITPSGLDAMSYDGSRFHSTTAQDLARIMSYCILESPKKDEFRKITATQNHQFNNYRKVSGDSEYFEAGGRSHSASNHNAFLGMMEGAFSGKTGFTSKAGYCYVGALERDERVYVVALLACGWPNHRSYKWSDTRKLMEYGLNNYLYRNPFIVPDIDEIIVYDGIPESGRPNDTAYLDLKVDALGNESEKRLLREDEKVTIEIVLPNSLTAPVSIGEEVGKLNYYLSGEVIKEYPVIAGDTVERINYLWVLNYLLELFSINDR